MGRNMKRLLGCLLLITAAEVPDVSAAELSYKENNKGHDQLTALQCGTLLDVSQKRAFKNMTVLVSGEKIVSVMPSISTAPPPHQKAVKIIDLKDKVCLPGLMDMHSHMMMSDFSPLGEADSASLTVAALPVL